MPPTIKCPADIITETAKDQNYAYVNWTIPEVTDNTDAPPPPILWTKPHIVFPWKAKIGTSIVVYIAQDASGNKARCKFKIKVLGLSYLEIRLTRSSSIDKLLIISNKIIIVDNKQ